MEPKCTSLPIIGRKKDIRSKVLCGYWNLFHPLPNKGNKSYQEMGQKQRCIILGKINQDVNKIKAT